MSRETAREARNFDAVRFTLRVASRRRRNPNVVVEARKSDLVRRHRKQCADVNSADVARPRRRDIRRPLEE
jgi:hypothetical protein